LLVREFRPERCLLAKQVELFSASAMYQLGTISLSSMRMLPGQQEATSKGSHLMRIEIFVVELLIQGFLCQPSFRETKSCNWPIHLG
jgi:hypothetical protein